MTDDRLVAGVAEWLSGEVFKTFVASNVDLTNNFDVNNARENNNNSINEH